MTDEIVITTLLLSHYGGCDEETLAIAGPHGRGGIVNNNMVSICIIDSRLPRYTAAARADYHGQTTTF